MFGLKLRRRNHVCTNCKAAKHISYTFSTVEIWSCIGFQEIKLRCISRIDVLLMMSTGRKFIIEHPNTITINLYAILRFVNRPDFILIGWNVFQCGFTIRAKTQLTIYLFFKVKFYECGHLSINIIKIKMYQISTIKYAVCFYLYRICF